MRQINLSLLLPGILGGASLLFGQNPLPDNGKPPIVLLNGFQTPTNLLDILRYGVCPVSQANPPSRTTFGELENVLKSAGYQVLFFDNCVHCPGKSLTECGAALGKFLSESLAGEGKAIPEADLVAHSMGGLIVRAYLSGMKADGTFAPPDPHRVRKVVMLASPNFGSYWAAGVPAITPQIPELAPGSHFLWRLATWNNGRDDLRGVDALAVVGNGCSFGDWQAASDGVVSLMSASLNFTKDAEHTRVLPYRHTEIGSICPDRTSIANVDGRAHLSAQAVLSFLDGTEDWRFIGMSGNEDFYLLRYGAGMAAHAGATRLISGAGVEWQKSPEPNPDNVFFTQMVPSEATDLWFEAGGMWIRYDAVIPVGTTLATTVKK